MNDPETPVPNYYHTPRPILGSKTTNNSCQSLPDPPPVKPRLVNDQSPTFPHHLSTVRPLLFHAQFQAGLRSRCCSAANSGELTRPSLAILYYTSQDQEPSVNTIHGYLGHPTSVKKMHHRLPYRPIWWEKFSQLGFSLAIEL